MTVRARALVARFDDSPRSVGGVVARERILVFDDDSFDDEIKTIQGPIVVDFWANWCDPCKTIAPRLEQLAEELAGRAHFASVDVDENGDLVNRFGIMSVPTLVVFKDGKVVDQLIGAAPKEKIRALVSRHLA
jgi:thioredoxin 1